MPTRIDVAIDSATPPAFYEIQDTPMDWDRALPVHCKNGGVADKLFGDSNVLVMCAFGEPDEGRVMWVHTNDDGHDCYWICTQGYEIGGYHLPPAKGKDNCLVKWSTFTRSELGQHLISHEYPCGFNNLVRRVVFNA